MTTVVAIEYPDQPDTIALLQEGSNDLLARFGENECFTLGLDELRSDRTKLWTLRNDGLPVGCIALVEHDTWAEIKRMYVKAGERGQGWGGDLLRTVLDYANKQQIKTLRLETAARLEAAVRLYQRHGFHQIPAFGEYIHSSVSLCMERNLD